MASSPISTDEEGNVLYFIKRSPDGKEELETLSLTKLKTLEYRLFRKMREKLRNFYSNDLKGQSNQRFKEIVKRFKRESQTLIDEG